MGRYLRMVNLDRPGTVGATGPKRTAKRFPLDYATWRNHLAAPGSRFASDGTTLYLSVPIEAMNRHVEDAASESERRAA